MKGQLSKFSQVVSRNLSHFVEIDQWHCWDLPVSFTVLAFQSKPMLLNLCEFEWLWVSTAPFPQEKLGHHIVKVKCIFEGLEIPLQCRVFELSMVPINNIHPISFTVSQVSWQVTSYSGPEKRRNSPHGWQMVLIDVI